MAEHAPGTGLRWVWRIVGIVLGLAVVVDALTLTGVLPEGPLVVDWTHVVLHAVLSGAALWMGFAQLPAARLRSLTLPIAGVYALLGLLGFLDSELFGLAPAIGLTLEPGENGLHLLIGLVALAFALRIKPSAAPARA